MGLSDDTIQHRIILIVILIMSFIFGKEHLDPPLEVDPNPWPMAIE